MFLPVELCYNHDVRIEKLHHMATIIASHRRSDIDELMHDLDGAQTQFQLTDRTKELITLLDELYESEVGDYAIASGLHDNGFKDGVVLELTFYTPNSIGRPILYIYAESELEVKAFAEQVIEHIWKEEDER